MKHRWIGGALLVVALTMAACAPRQGGAGASASPDGSAAQTTEASAEPTSSASAEPMETVEPSQSESAEPTPDNYEY
jgi:hypothetical protein